MALFSKDWVANLGWVARDFIWVILHHVSEEFTTWGAKVCDF